MLLHRAVCLTTVLRRSNGYLLSCTIVEVNFMQLMKHGSTFSARGLDRITPTSTALKQRIFLCIVRITGAYLEASPHDSARASKLSRRENGRWVATSAISSAKLLRAHSLLVLRRHTKGCAGASRPA